MNRVVEYKSIKDDIIESKNQSYKLKDNYKYIHKNIFYIIASYLVYYLFLIVSVFYKLFKGIKYNNRKLLKGKYFLYGNHTSQFGDIFNPILMSFPKRCYIICSPANLGIPVIGKLLPLLGAIPIPEDLHQMVEFKKCIKHHINKGNPVVIYPEAHLWPWYTGIREFDSVSFMYPAELNTKVYICTTTYTKAKHDKPKMSLYIDGPFVKDDNLNKHDNADKFRNEVYDTLKEKSKLSNYDYITYKKKD